MIGVGPLAWAGGAVGLAMAQSELAQGQVDRGFVPDLSFETDASFQGELADTAFQRLKAQLSERVGRMRSGVAPLLLEAGLKANALGTPGREAQFHEARVLGLEDIARIYGVPLSVVGLGKNASYGA
jgi:phage portal protein BeeE